MVDLVRGISPPFDPAAVVEELSALAKQYRIREVFGDNYSAEWTATAFRENGLRYTANDLPMSGLALEALPQFMRGQLQIPNHPKLIKELRLLERRTSRQGRDIIGHGRNGNDDHCSALFSAMRPRQWQRLRSASLQATAQAAL